MAGNDIPKVNRGQIDDVVESFKNVYQIARSITSAFARRYSVDGTSSIVIISEWRQHSLERGCFLKIQRTMLTDGSFKSCLEINTVDVSHWLMSAFSASGKFTAVLRRDPSEDAKNKMKYYLEIWNEGNLLTVFDLAALGLHGAVYTDELLGALNWSCQEDRVVYVAEKNQPKKTSFYQQKFGFDLRFMQDEEYMYKEDWGEQMAQKCQPVIVICDVLKKNLSVLNGIPENVSPGQVHWDPSGGGVVGVGFYSKPSRLGITSFTNRPAFIFHLTLNGTYRVLSEENMSVMSPRFSPNGEYLIWLQCLSGGPHQTTCALMKCEWSTKKVTSVVDIVSKVLITENGKDFFGIYPIRFPRRCWTSDSKFIIFSTCQRDRINSYAVSVDNGTVWDIGSSNEDESTFVLDISRDNFAICSKTSLTQTPVLATIYVPGVVTKQGDCLGWNCITKPIVNDNSIFRFTVIDFSTDQECCFAVYYGPKSEKHHSIPLIVYPHGGPHSSTSNVYNPAFHFFTLLGYGILILNHRGSLGCGKDFVDALPGKVGTQDVQDCYLAIQNALQKYPWLDPNNVVLFGVSYGGFIVTHLSSKYPDEFKAVVAKSPITNILSIVFNSDVPDWSTVECGFPYDGIAAVMRNSKLWIKMMESSPIYSVASVKAPTLLLLGKKDVRVSFSQGLSYYSALKELNVPTRTLLYEDNHLFSTVPAEMDSIINTALWFLRYTD